MKNDKENLEKYRKHVFKCWRCGYCRDTVSDYSYGGELPPRRLHGVCPVYEVKRFDHYTARGRMQIARAILSGKLKYSPELIDVIYTCIGCRACVQQCYANAEKKEYFHIREGIDTPNISRAMKRDIVNSATPPYNVSKLAQSVEKNHNPYGERHEDRWKWTDGLDISQRSDIVFFCGCTPAYRRQEIAQATSKILRKLGIKFSILGEEWCCGSPLLGTGFRDLAEKMVHHNMEALKDVKKIVFSCAGCYRSFKIDYPEIVGKLPFEVQHITEFMADLLRENKMKFAREIEESVTYHDPCHLGRHAGVFEEPRIVLKATPGVKFVELPSIKEYAMCCGGGSGVKAAFPDLAVDIATRRLNAAREVGAEILISSCPFCKTNLADAAAKEKDVKVLDITELVLKAL